MIYKQHVYGVPTTYTEIMTVKYGQIHIIALTSSQLIVICVYPNFYIPIPQQGYELFEGVTVPFIGISLCPLDKNYRLAIFQISCCPVHCSYVLSLLIAWAAGWWTLWGLLPMASDWGRALRYKNAYSIPLTKWLRGGGNR